MKSSKKNLISFSLAMSLLILVAGCGKNDDNGNAQPPGGTGGGLGATPTPSPGVNWCQFPSVYPDGTQKCIYTAVNKPPMASLLDCTPGIPCPPGGIFWSNGLNTTRFPRLGSAHSSLIVTSVEANDTIIFEGDGSYGQADNSTTCGDDDLDEINIAGFHGATQRTNPSNGQEAGLLARVQQTGTSTVDYYNLGAFGVATVTNPGLLTWGYNSPYTYNCHYLRVDRLEIHRCKKNGASVYCPQP